MNDHMTPEGNDTPIMMRNVWLIQKPGGQLYTLH